MKVAPRYGIDSTAVSIFVDVLVELTYTQLGRRRCFLLLTQSGLDEVRLLPGGVCMENAVQDTDVFNRRVS